MHDVAQQWASEQAGVSVELQFMTSSAHPSAEEAAYSLIHDGYFSTSLPMGLFGVRMVSTSEGNMYSLLLDYFKVGHYDMLLGAAVLVCAF